MTGGFFITFEGGEGVGKTTQITKLAKTLKDEGHDVVITREPGGTPAGEEIRTLLSHEEFGGKWSAEAELMLLFAARAMHVTDVILPALAAGKTVLCDRYIDSTRVYQGHIQGVDMDFILNLENKIIAGAIPNLTLIMDLPSAIAMERVQARGAMDHYDRESAEFYERLRQGFIKIAQENPDRCAMVDASKTEDEIAAFIEALVNKRMA